MYVLAEILFDGDYEEVIIAVGADYIEKYDDYIFFYVDSEEDLESLKKEGVEDFVVTRILERYDTAEEIF